MLPVLLDLTFLKIYTFGVFLMLAFFWSTFLLWKNFLLTSHKEEEIFDHLFLGLFGGLFISRLVYVGLHFSEFGYSFLKFILINGYPGLSLYGFMFGFLISIYLSMNRSKVKFSETIDYFVPSAFVALAFGKIGAFFSGAEVGAKTNFPLKLKYVGADGMRHLTPLYEGILFLIGGFIAYQLLFSIRREKFAKNINLFFFFWFVGLVLACSDLLKDSTAIMFSTISFNALISYFLLLTFSAYFIYYFRSSVFAYVKSNFKKFHKKS